MEHDAVMFFLVVSRFILRITCHQAKNIFPLSWRYIHVGPYGLNHIARYEVLTNKSKVWLSRVRFYSSRESSSLHRFVDTDFTKISSWPNQTKVSVYIPGRLTNSNQSLGQHQCGQVFSPHWYHIETPRFEREEIRDSSNNGACSGPKHSLIRISQTRQATTFIYTSIGPIDSRCLHSAQF